MGSAQSKVAQLIETYELASMGAELERAWLGNTGERQSLRDLADRFNQALLMAAIRDAGMDVIDGEPANFYRLLTDDNVSAGKRIEARNRLDRAGIDWRLLDARTDLGIPVVVAVLVDRHGLPEVSVAAAAAVDASGAAQSALEEAIQTRRYQQHLRARTEERPSLSALSPAEVGREERLLAWSERGAAAELSVWTDTEPTTTPAEIDAETGPLDASDVVPTVTDTWDVYTVDVTTRDVAAAGFTVVRVLAPAAQPLYLGGAHRYWGGDRLSTVPGDRGYSSKSPAPTELNDCPHPFP